MRLHIEYRKNYNLQQKFLNWHFTKEDSQMATKYMKMLLHIY